MKNLVKVMSRDECVIRGLESLKEFAKVFSKILKPGDIVYLKGDLGTGKTTFVKNVCRALGVKDDIASPTFTIMREYSLKKNKIYHFDMYRIADYDELSEFGFEDYIYNNENDFVFIEWPDILEENVDVKHILIEIERIDDETRKYVISR